LQGLYVNGPFASDCDASDALVTGPRTNVLLSAQSSRP